MHVLLPLLILAMGPDMSVETRHPGASPLFHCTFDESSDENFDAWPDGWIRMRGPRYPRYVQISISSEQSPAEGRCLRFDLDGKAAVAYSPPIDVGPLFGYVLEGLVKTEGLKYDRAYFSLTLMNRERERLQTVYSQKVRETLGWKKLRVGPISLDGDEVRFAIIGLHVEPESRQDLTGTVLFGDVWLGRLPRMALRTNDPYNFFTDPEEIEITCTVSGFLDKSPRVLLQLEDVLGKEVVRQQRRLRTKPAARSSDLSLESFSEGPSGVIGNTRWKPTVPDPGFYRVKATMQGRDKLAHRRELNLILIDPRRSPARGEFGWTLPRGDQPLPLARLNPLLGQSGINWVKYPLWHDGENDAENDDEFVETLITFSDRLAARGIEMVGLLHDPPDSVRSRYGEEESPAIADILAADPKVWEPSLEPTVSRLASRINWWQLGHDQDSSFAGHAGPLQKIAQIKGVLDQVGQDVNLGIGWGWINQLPQSTDGEVPWRSLIFSAEPPLTPQELTAYLEASKDMAFQRWVVLEPLPASDYPLEVRAEDLVRRMIAAKVHGVEAISCPQPFSTERGLMHDDGTPGELFMPWRTAALALAGAEYLGSVQLPHGSPNQIFTRADDAVMIVWNDSPSEEVIYLGEDVRQIDLWGRSVTPPKKAHRQVIRVGRLPTFVTGLNTPITRWRMDFSLARDRIPSVFNRAQQNSFRVQNQFAQGARGQAEVVVPEAWMVNPRTVPFRLEGDDSLQHRFEIKLPYNASSGRHEIRVDFEIQAEEHYQFSVFRRLGVGSGDLYIEIVTRLSDQGDLEIQQRLVNETSNPVSFRCYLFTPDRRRLMTEIPDLGRKPDVQTYRLTNGKKLLGETLWLRAEEINGPRVLNYQFVAQE